MHEERFPDVKHLNLIPCGILGTLETSFFLLSWKKGAGTVHKCNMYLMRRSEMRGDRPSVAQGSPD